MHEGVALAVIFAVVVGGVVEYGFGLLSPGDKLNSSSKETEDLCLLELDGPFGIDRFG
jgi:hypothetical protein